MSHAKPDFAPEKLRRYPHMFPLDIAIWERFLQSPDNSYTGFDYDVKVGTGTEPLEGTPPEYTRMQGILSKFRIDVVGYLPSRIDIIEVKPEASTVAIGQIIAYRALYLRDFSPTLPVHGVIVTDHAIPDMEFLTKEHDIGYYVV